MTGAHAVCVSCVRRGFKEEPTPKIMHFFVGHEFGVSGHGDDRRPRRCAWTCPRGILSLTTGMRFGLRLGPFLFGVRAHHHHHYRYVVRRPTEALRRPTEALRRPTEAVRRPTEALHSEATPTHDVAQNRAPSLLYPILA